jgi:hypothetical protein
MALGTAVLAAARRYRIACVYDSPVIPMRLRTRTLNSLPSVTSRRFPPVMLTRVLITVYSQTMNEAIQREHVVLVLSRRFRTRAATGLESGGRLSASKTL